MGVSMWPGISSQRGRKCPNGPRAEMHRGDWKVSRLKTGGERELPGRRVLNGIKAIAPMVNGNKNVQTQMLSWTCSPQLESCEHRSAEATICTQHVHIECCEYIHIWSVDKIRTCRAHQTRVWPNEDGQHTPRGIAASHGAAALQIETGNGDAAAEGRCKGDRPLAGQRSALRRASPYLHPICFPLPPCWQAASSALSSMGICGRSASSAPSAARAATQPRLGHAASSCQGSTRHLQAIHVAAVADVDM